MLNIFNFKRQLLHKFRYNKKKSFFSYHHSFTPKPSLPYPLKKNIFIIKQYCTNSHNNNTVIHQSINNEHLSLNDYNNMVKEWIHLNDTLSSIISSDIQSDKRSFIQTKESLHNIDNILKERLNNLYNNGSLSQLSSIVHDNLIEFGYQKTSNFCRNFFTVDQLIDILPSTELSNEKWREEDYFELLVDVMSHKGVLRDEWTIENTVKLIGKLPRTPIRLKMKKSIEMTSSSSPSIIKDDMDEESSSIIVKGDDDKNLFLTNIGTLNMDSHSILWRPQEIGKLIGIICRHEYDIDKFITLISDLSILQIHENEDDIRWNELLGYIGEIFSESLATNKHWIDEDYAWCLNQLIASISPYIRENFDDYKEKEHILFIADVICMIVMKNGISKSDTGMIHILLNMVCSEWPEDDHKLLSDLIEARMKQKSIFYRIKKNILNRLKPNKGNRNLDDTKYRDFSRLYTQFDISIKNENLNFVKSKILYTDDLEEAIEKNTETINFI